MTARLDAPRAGRVGDGFTCSARKLAGIQLDYSVTRLRREPTASPGQLSSSGLTTAMLMDRPPPLLQVSTAPLKRTPSGARSPSIR